MTYHTHIKEFFRKIYFKLAGNVVHLRSKRKIRGNVLLSYITLPFFWDKDDPRFGGHSQYWEVRCMARAFLDRGYAVDVIEWSNDKFTPKKKYDYFIDIGANMERLAPLLNVGCLKIIHITHADAAVQNEAEHTRIAHIEKTRGIKLAPPRVIPETKGIVYADIATALSNGWSMGTYAYARKDIRIIPISTTHTFPSPATKDFARAKKHFIWFGGGGAALKGLDLLLVAFSEMPEYTLTICGKAPFEKDFARAFKKELAEYPNIHVVGHVDPGNILFDKIRNGAVAMIHPSFSEGASGSVILAMHAGLIPIVSKESSVHTDEFGIELRENSIQVIQESVKEIAQMSEKKLRDMAVQTWEYARAHNTRKHFAEEFGRFLDTLEKNNA